MGTTNYMTNGIWLAGLLVIPGLFGLALLMAWMESRLTRQMVVYDVSKAWLSSNSPEEVEELVRRSAARLRLDRPQPISTPQHGGRA
jgi:hypothetical protein